MMMMMETEVDTDTTRFAWLMRKWIVMTLNMLRVICLVLCGCHNSVLIGPTVGTYGICWMQTAWLCDVVFLQRSHTGPLEESWRETSVD